MTSNTSDSAGDTRVWIEVCTTSHRFGAPIIFFVQKNKLLVIAATMVETPALSLSVTFAFIQQDPPNCQKKEKERERDWRINV